MIKSSLLHRWSRHSRPSESLISLFFSSSSSSLSSMALTGNEISEINLLVPRLCESNHLPEAVRLVAAAILANPPPNSLPTSALTDRLASEPDMSQSMSLLNLLKRTTTGHRPRPSLRPILLSFLSSYLQKRRLREALKVLNWMSRPDSPCPPDATAFSLVVNGFCRQGPVLEALKVLRAMLAAELVPAAELRACVYRGLLKEARIGEANKLKEGLVNVGSVDEGGEGVGKALETLDHLIAKWVE